MESKICTKCGVEKSLEDFAWKSKKYCRKASECKECHRKIRNDLYDGKSDDEKIKIKERKLFIRKLFIRKWLVDYKKNAKCERCGEDHPATIQFHHKDSNEKEIDISNAAKYGWSIKRILREINKCEILCANCHTKEHFSETFDCSI